MTQPLIYNTNQVHAQQGVPQLNGSRPVDGHAYPYGTIINPSHNQFGGSRVIGGSRVNGSVITNSYGPPGVRVVNGPVGSNIYSQGPSIISRQSAIR